MFLSDLLLTGEKRWTKLNHSGVLFPPEYEVHGIKMLYEGRPVDLTPEQEEVATMFAVMKETDYVKKERFLKNFWDAFKPILGKGHIIRDLKKCDFTPIYEHHMAEREAKKALPKEVFKQCFLFLILNCCTRTLWLKPKVIGLLHIKGGPMTTLHELRCKGTPKLW